MRSKMNVLVSLMTLALGSVAFADVPTTTQKQISFAELKERCDHPEQFDVQRAPQNIRVQCSQVYLDLVEAVGTNDIQFADRKVSTAVFADKFYVASEEKQLPRLKPVSQCPVYKEVQKTLTIERPLGCADLTSIKGELADYCALELDSTETSNPKLVEVKETGRIVDTCAGIAPLPR